MNFVENSRFFVGYPPYSFPVFVEEEAMQVGCEVEKPRLTLADVLVSIERGELTLRDVPVEFFYDRSVVLFAVQHDGFNLQYASEEFRDDWGVVAAAVQQTWIALRYASPRLRGDRVIVAIGVKQDCLALLQASPELQKDREIILTAIRYGRLSLHFVPKEFLHDRGVVMAAIERDGLELRFVPQPLRCDLEIIQLALRKNFQPFVYIRDPKIILFLMQEKPEVFQYVEDPLIALAIVGVDGRFLRYGSREIRSNLEVALLAVQNHWMAFYYVSEDVRRNSKVISAAMSYHPETFQGTPDELSFHRRWILKAIETNPRMLYFVSHLEIVLEVVRKDWKIARYINQDLFRDQQFAFSLLDQDQRILQYIKDRNTVLLYMQEDPTAYCFVSEHLKKDEEIAMCVLYNDYYAFEYVPSELWKKREVVLAFLSDLVSFWEERALHEQVQALLLPILQTTSDREIAFKAIEGTLGWAFQHLSAAFRGDRAIALFAVRTNPEAFLHVSQELSQDPLLISCANGESFEGTFRVGYADVVNKPRETLAGLWERIEADACFPFIQYTHSLGFDAGGLTRDLVARLLKTFFDLNAPIFPGRQQDEKFIPQLYEISSLSYLEQAAFYRAIGAIFAFALINYQGLRTGMHFHEIVFSMIYSITQEEMQYLRFMGEEEGFPEDLYNKLLKIYLKDQYPLVFVSPFEDQRWVDRAVDEFVDRGNIPEALEKEYEGMSIVDKKTEFLRDFRIYHTIVAVLYMVKSMSRYATEGQWNALKGASPLELQERIEGSLSRQQILDALRWDAADQQTRQWLIYWIETASFEQLERFVFVMTGAFSLGTTQRLHIHLYAEDQQLPSFRACTFTMNLPKGYADYPTFKAKLELSLAEGGEGFQFS